MAKREKFEQFELFSGGNDYYAYRIPCLNVTGKGTLLAFCEGRKNSLRDDGEIDIVLKRSLDHGESWEEQQIVVSGSDMTCGNPCPVVNKKTGDVLLLFCKNKKEDEAEKHICEGKAERTVWITKSSDEGKTWSMPSEITSQVKKSNWSWYATGPAHGIQLSSGRLVIPCDHICAINHNLETDPYHSHVIFSDDNGASWSIGGSVEDGTNECTVLERTDGTVYINCRNPKEIGQRAFAVSTDGGISFGSRMLDETLVEPSICNGCQASVLRYTDEKHQNKNRVLFSNPAFAGRQRRNMTVRLSYDECTSWPVSKPIYADGSGYSDLAVDDNMDICCLYERGTGDYDFHVIYFSKFNLEWLTSSHDQL